MRDSKDAFTGGPALRELDTEVLVQAFLWRRCIVLRVKVARIKDRSGTPLVGLVTNVIARRDGDGDGLLGHRAQGVLATGIRLAVRQSLRRVRTSMWSSAVKYWPVPTFCIVVGSAMWSL